MRQSVVKVVLSCFVVIFSGCAAPQHPAGPLRDRDAISQISTLDAVLAGAYDGEMTIGELKKMGDAGIGTFHALDGEMTVWEGEVYQVTADGKVGIAEDGWKTPFASVTWFDRDFTLGEEAAVYLDATPRFHLILPEKSAEFDAADLGKDRTEELNEAER